MSRDIHPNDRENHVPAREPELGEMRAAVLSREPELRRGRGYICQISDVELQTLQDVGRFRTIELRDIERFRYQGDAAKTEQALQSLEAQNLVRRQTLWTGGRREQLTVLALTPSGKAVVQGESRLQHGQAIYSGLVKPAEVGHDAAIYRMYYAEAEKIAQAGGRIHRIVLDYELKRHVYSPLAKAKHLPPIDYAQQQSDIARQNGLKVIRGKILLPDLRIEYETRDGASASIDLELATHHYRGSMMRGKAEAGFKFYASAESVSHLASAFDPEFAVQIFSF